MKKLLFIIGIVFYSLFMDIHAQGKNYTQMYDSVRKQNVYEGLLTISQDHQFHKDNFFFSDISFPDSSSKSLYKPLLKALMEVSKKENIAMIIVGGIWWCPDTRDILSQLVEYTDKAHFENITSIGVDRKKKSLSYDLVNQYHIERVPTLIIIKNNQEIGRVVEYGKNGHWEKELASILHKAIK